MKRYFILFVLLSLLFACGQKGELYLPKEAENQQQEHTINQEKNYVGSLDNPSK